MAGATTGAAGTVGFWLGRNEALIVAALGLGYLIILLIRHTRAGSVSRDRLSHAAAEETHIVRAGVEIEYCVPQRMLTIRVDGETI